MAFELMVIDTLDDLKAMVLEQTAKYKASPEKAKEELSPFATELLAAWEQTDKFGCQQPHVSALLSAIVLASTGEKVTFKGAKSTADAPRPCTAMTVVKSDRGGFRKGETYLVYGVDDDGDPRVVYHKDGNFLATYFRGEWKYATDGEIESLFVALEPIAQQVLTRTPFARLEKE